MKHLIIKLGKNPVNSKKNTNASEMLGVKISEIEKHTFSYSALRLKWLFMWQTFNATNHSGEL